MDVIEDIQQNGLFGLSFVFSKEKFKFYISIIKK